MTLPAVQTVTSTTSLPAVPRPEHPRPIFQREPWINLNGRWRFTFDQRDLGEQSRWYRIRPPELRRDTDMDAGGAARPFGAPRPSTLVDDPFGAEIVVPFPWESRLSGIQQDEQKGAAWYQRIITVPTDWSKKRSSVDRIIRNQAGRTQKDRPAGEKSVASTDAGNDGQSGVSGAGASDAEGLDSAEDTASSSVGLGADVQWRLRPYLCFGAVDWNAKMWVNGRFVAEHDGGYTPFDLDLSSYVLPGQPAALTVRVWDNSAADTPLGKQTINWYTSSSGIWQTVWLEGRPAAYLTRIHVTPRLEENRAIFDLAACITDADADGRYRLTISSRDGAFPETSETVTLSGDEALATVDVRVPNPRAWSPEDPYLYECSVSLARMDGEGEGGDTDTIQTYFGLRTVSKGTWDGKPYEYVFLNGEPVYLRGALDQAFHPDALHAYPSDEAIRADVQAAKDAGLNFLRCHIKINDPRYYYWCDRLGVLMMYDFPSCRVYTAKARANWEATFRASLERDYSHPCIFSWILFNETWGLEEHQTPASWAWVKEMFNLCKRLDSTRLVEDNSACLYDHVDTDINTWHFYIAEHDRARRHVQRVVDQTYEGSTYNYVSGLYDQHDDAGTYKQGTQPLLNSEYAGLSARQGDKDISYTFKYLTTELRRHDKICGYVYTELFDIEWEHNGFLNYDRTWKEFGYDHFVDGMTLADLNGADHVGLDCAPCQTLAPGSRFNASAFVSHWDGRAMKQPALQWRVTFMDRFGERREIDRGERRLDLKRYGVTDAGTVEATLPDEPGLATVALLLVDLVTADVRVRNYVNVELTTGSALPSEERLPNGSGRVFRFSPADFTDSNWPNPRLGSGGAKFGAGGAGWVEYSVPLSGDVDTKAVTGLRLRFEAGARTARSRVGWHDAKYELSTDYPQTEAYKLPSEVTVSVNGVPVGTVALPDDPADARGVLSAHNSTEWEFASFGFLSDIVANGETAARILAATVHGQLAVRFEVPRSGLRGGLNLYGARLGAYPIDPMVILDV